MKKFWFVGGVLSFLLLLVDQGTKYLFCTRHLGQSFFVVSSFNHGISWSLPVPYVLMLLVALLALVFLFWYAFQKKISLWVFVFLFAGIVGNLLDRVFLHGVRDFIMIHLFNFPIFNFADVFLTVGVLLLAKQEFFPGNSKEKH